MRSSTALFAVVFFVFVVLWFVTLSTWTSTNVKSRAGPSLLELKNKLLSLEQQHDSLRNSLKDIELFYRGEGDLISINGERKSILTSEQSKSQLKVDVKSSTVDRKAVSAKHFPDPISFNSPGNDDAESVLVVGGTDGSGTRRVVQILTQLGVKMVSEDPETYDIHADLVGGWPVAVTPVLQHTKTLDYDPATFPKALSEKTLPALRRLLARVQEDSVKPESHVLAVGGVLSTRPGVTARKVKYGFKAPVAMTLTPLWAELLPHFKFLHVLRDGRDIAFSANQGPVEKFYSAMYGSDRAAMALSAPIRGVKLWSDWNAGVHKWARRKIEASSKKAASNLRGLVPDQTLGYFAIHSEDLVSDVVEVKFAAISHLARWVGSSLGTREICCIAVSGSQFMGSHDRTDRKSVQGESQLSSRYGKWRQKVRSDGAMSVNLHREGQEGLKLFGYEPERQLSEKGWTSESGETCTLSPTDCGAPAPPPVLEFSALSTYSLINPRDSSDSKRCNAASGVDFRGEGSDLFSVNLGDVPADEAPYECCKRCWEDLSCKFFTFEGKAKVCYLKINTGRLVQDASTSALVSGSVVRS